MKTFFAAIALLFVFSMTYSQIPGAISYQGIIIDPATGETAANGPHSVKFAFYDAAENGNFKWETSAIVVNTFKGLFTTIIPIPENTNWTPPLYVQLTVDGVVLSTRVQLTTVPFAYRASSADKAIAMDAAGLSGTIADARLSAHLQDLADGTLTGSKVGAGVNASMVDNGTLPNSVLDTNLQDLADGTLSGSKVGAGINASMIDNGTLPNTVLDSDLQDLADDGVLSASRIEDLNASKVTAGTFDAARIPDLDAAKITSGTIDALRLPNSVVSGTGVADRIPYWTSANSIGYGNPGLVWQATQNELGVNIQSPVASLHVAHDFNHPLNTSVKIDNSSNVNSTKYGIDLQMTSNPNAEVNGLNILIDGSGNGPKIGVKASIDTPLSNEGSNFGGFFNIAGQGIGLHAGVYGLAENSGTGNNTGIFGEAIGAGTGTKKGVDGSSSGSGNTKYGVNGSASGTGTFHYGVFGSSSGGSNSNVGVRGIASGGVNAYGVFGSASSAGNNYAVYASGVLAYTSSLLNASDKRLKKDITPMPSTLSKILLLEPSNYYMRKAEFPRMNFSEEKKYGLIAQDVERIFPSLVKENVIGDGPETDGNPVDTETRYKAIDYTSLIPILIKGMQEQQAMIEELKAEVKKIKSSEAFEKKSEPRLVKASLNK